MRVLYQDPSEIKPKPHMVPKLKWPFYPSVGTDHPFCGLKYNQYKGK